MIPTEFRRHMLDSNVRLVKQAIRQTQDENIPEPWGVILDMENHHGRQFATLLERGKGFDQRMEAGD